jgi:hypothetical protein
MKATLRDNRVDRRDFMVRTDNLWRGNSLLVMGKTTDSRPSKITGRGRSTPPRRGDFSVSSILRMIKKATSFLLPSRFNER